MSEENILCVDDDALILYTIQRDLCSQFEIVPAQSGEEAQLFAGNAKRGARYSSREQVNAGKVFSPEMAKVLLNHIPMRAVLAEGRAKLWFKFNGAGVIETCHFQAKGLPAPSRSEQEIRIARQSLVSSPTAYAS